MCYRLLFLACWFGFATAANAQTSERVSALQNARNLVVTTDKKQTYYYMVSSEQSQMIYRKDGLLVIGNDSFEPKTVSLRLKAMPRFALDEDSAIFESKYAVDNGLLAFRRTMNVGKWNSIVVPFSLTGWQVAEAFGEQARLAAVKGIVEDDMTAEKPKATLEFQTLSLATDDVVLQAGVHYLLKPTRQPDIDADGTTSVVYGTGKVKGPLYIIPGVSMASGQRMPANANVLSESGDVRMRIRGTYTCRDDKSKVVPTSRALYALNDAGKFYELMDSTVIKAFRSWLENSSKVSDVQVRFCIDGIDETYGAPTGIADMAGYSDALLRPDADCVYDLQGRVVGRRGSFSGMNGRPGIYIVNGRKVVIK